MKISCIGGYIYLSVKTPRQLQVPVRAMANSPEPAGAFDLDREEEPLFAEDLEDEEDPPPLPPPMPSFDQLPSAAGGRGFGGTTLLESGLDGGGEVVYVTLHRPACKV